MSETDSSERESVKLRRLLFSRSRKKGEIKKENSSKKKYKFRVMKMSWDQALDVRKNVISKIKNDEESLRGISIRNFQPLKDTQEFVRVYNRAFLTAPDPYRALSSDDIKHFNPESTFVAILYNRIVGFVFLTIEPVMKNGVNVGNQGVIAGIGVDPRFRRKSIAFLLAAKAAEYFEEHDVIELICEVYHENKVSYNFIINFGMREIGVVYL
ncbi:MAG: GNAT family N-acetyltransferase [Candidatus Hodarchaeales archaeon]